MLQKILILFKNKWFIMKFPPSNKQNKKTNKKKNKTKRFEKERKSWETKNIMWLPIIF